MQNDAGSMIKGERESQGGVEKWYIATQMGIHKQIRRWNVIWKRENALENCGGVKEVDLINDVVLSLGKKPATNGGVSSF